MFKKKNRASNKIQNFLVEHRGMAFSTAEIADKLKMRRFQVYVGLKALGERTRSLERKYFRGIYYYRIRPRPPRIRPRISLAWMDEIKPSIWQRIKMQIKWHWR